MENLRTETLLPVTQSARASRPIRPARPALWTARILTGLIVAFLLLRRGRQVVAIAPVVEGTTQRLGYQRRRSFGRSASLLALSTLLFTWSADAVHRRVARDRLSRRRDRARTYGRTPAGSRS